MMELKNITKCYHGQKVVDNVSLTLPKKQVVSVIGPNGAGKSTLLHIMTRLTEPDGGEVVFGGRPLRDWKSGDLARHISILTQNSSIQSKLTVRELISLGRFPYCRGRLAPEDEKFVERSLEFMELEDCRDRYLDQLSGGQRQRALIGMVLAQDTETVMLDEPTNSLDIYHAVRLMKTARRLCGELGKTVVMVLHEINYASFYSDSIIAMKDGRLAGIGTPEEMIRPAFLRDMYHVEFTVIPMHGKPLSVYYQGVPSKDV